MFGELAAWCYSTAAFIAKSSFLNAPFVSAFLGAIPAACLGALAGAYTAWRNADRSKIEAKMIEEIKNTNKAIQIAAHICNSVLNLKIGMLDRLKTNLIVLDYLSLKEDSRTIVVYLSLWRTFRH